MPNPNDRPQDPVPPDQLSFTDPYDEAAAKVDDPGGAHAAGYAADPSPPKVAPGGQTYPAEPPRDEGG